MMRYVNKNKTYTSLDGKRYIVLANNRIFGQWLNYLNTRKL